MQTNRVMSNDGYLVLELCHQLQSFPSGPSPMPSSQQSLGREYDDCPTLVITKCYSYSMTKLPTEWFLNKSEIDWTAVYLPLVMLISNFLLYRISNLKIRYQSGYLGMLYWVWSGMELYVFMCCDAHLLTWNVVATCKAYINSDNRWCSCQEKKRLKLKKKQSNVPTFQSKLTMAAVHRVQLQTKIKK